VAGWRARQPSGYPGARHSGKHTAGRRGNPPAYDRPPLSKKLWFGKARVEDIFIHDQRFYDDLGVSMMLGTRVEKLDTKEKFITAANGERYGFGKLLLATGTKPRRIAILAENSKVSVTTEHWTITCGCRARQKPGSPC